jgi:hypothetical protein
MLNTGYQQPRGVTIHQLTQSIDGEAYKSMHEKKRNRMAEVSGCVSALALIILGISGGIACAIVGGIRSDVGLAAGGFLGLFFSSLFASGFFGGCVACVAGSCCRTDYKQLKKEILEHATDVDVGDRLLSADELTAYYQYLPKDDWKAISHSQLLHLHQNLPESEFEAILSTCTLTDEMQADWKILKNCKSTSEEEIAKALKYSYFIERIRQHPELLESAMAMIPLDKLATSRVVEALSICFDALGLQRPDMESDFWLGHGLSIKDAIDEAKFVGEKDLAFIVDGESILASKAVLAEGSPVFAAM